MNEKVKSQRKRFEQAARELGVDLDEEKLKATLQKITGKKISDSTTFKENND